METYIWLNTYEAVVACANTVEEARKIVVKEHGGKEIWDTGKFGDISIADFVKDEPTIIVPEDTSVIVEHANE